jgi:hypothetical protein
MTNHYDQKLQKPLFVRAAEHPGNLQIETWKIKRLP